MAGCRPSGALGPPTVLLISGFELRGSLGSPLRPEPGQPRRRTEPTPGRAPVNAGHVLPLPAGLAAGLRAGRRP